VLIASYTFLWQRRKDRSEKVAKALIDLYKAIGGWIDGVTRASEYFNSTEDTAKRISDFNEIRDGFAVQVRLALNNIPHESQYEAIRQGFDRFHENVYAAKMGLINSLLSPDESLDSQRWADRRERTLHSLRQECDELRRILDSEMSQLSA
jgi:hypothetical protein